VDECKPLIDGKPKHIPEDNRFWKYISTTKGGLKLLPGEKNRATLEFDFFMSGSEACNTHVVRLQSRWRGFVRQRRHRALVSSALRIQFYFRSFKAMRAMNLALAQAKVGRCRLTL